MTDAFGSTQPIMMLEPGRSLVAEAGVIQSEVVLVAGSRTATKLAGSIWTPEGSAA
jgi:diaminopimelate decarboxylase